MRTKNAILTALATAALVLGVPAAAQNARQLVERYTGLAGSKQNSSELVSGLRDSVPFTLTGGKTSTVIDPPTRKMGYGNVDNALALTQASLRKQGIAEPTPEQLKNALMGVLQQRADGKGWGAIAHAMGFELGELKRDARAGAKMARVQPELRTANAEAHRPEPAERFVRAERPERPARPERPERPERPAR